MLSLRLPKVSLKQQNMTRMIICWVTFAKSYFSDHNSREQMADTILNAMQDINENQDVLNLAE